jgi:hypothetical protein
VHIVNQVTKAKGNTNWKIVIAALILLAAAIAYFAYRAVQGGLPSCEPAFESCMLKCGGAAVDGAAARACQQACEVDRKTCLHATVMPDSLYGTERSNK